MFTGIIEDMAKIIDIDTGNFTVEHTFADEALVMGQSIAHDGACMTLIDITPNTYTFFAMQESLDKTNFWTKKIWDLFNRERCVQAWQRLDGHIVSWHIDTTGNVSDLQKHDDGSLLLGISFPTSWSIYTIAKGSIGINGVSLTIVDCSPGYISIRLIPHTQQITNLWSLQLWDAVNLEFDMYAKYIHKQHTTTSSP